MFHVEHFNLEEASGFLDEGLSKLNLNLPQSNKDKLFLYFDFLLKKNEQINLISKKSDLKNKVAVHLLDSLTPLLWSDWILEMSALDIGSGGGLPAIPLSIVFPGWHYDLAEATTKKAVFLDEVKTTLDLPRVSIINEYFNPGKSKNGLCYDLITTRAVTSLKDSAALVGPKLKVGGHFLAFKGPKGTEELKEASREIKNNNLKLADKISFTLPLVEMKRILYLFVKIKS